MLGPSIMIAGTPLAFDFARRTRKDLRGFFSTTALIIASLEMLALIAALMMIAGVFAGG